MAPGVYPPAREAWRQGRAPIANSIWQKTAAARLRLNTMKTMRAIGIGFNSDEAYVKGLFEQGRVPRRQGLVEQNILRLAMDAKIGDQQGGYEGPTGGHKEGISNVFWKWIYGL